MIFGVLAIAIISFVVGLVLGFGLANTTGR